MGQRHRLIYTCLAHHLYPVFEATWGERERFQPIISSCYCRCLAMQTWFQPSQSIAVMSSNNRHHCIAQAHSLSFFLCNVIYSHALSICISLSLLLCLNVLIHTSWNLGSPSYYLVGCYPLPKKSEVVPNKALYYTSCTQLFLSLTSMIMIKIRQ